MCQAPQDVAIFDVLKWCIWSLEPNKYIKYSYADFLEHTLIFNSHQIFIKRNSVGHIDWFSKKIARVIILFYATFVP